MGSIISPRSVDSTGSVMVILFGQTKHFHRSSDTPELGCRRQDHPGTQPPHNSARGADRSTTTPRQNAAANRTTPP